MQEYRDLDPIQLIGAKQEAITAAVNRIIAVGRTPVERTELLKTIDTELQKVLDTIKKAGV